MPQVLEVVVLVVEASLLVVLVRSVDIRVK
jgi:hypothetical protein